MNIRAAPSEEEKEVGNAEGGDGVESLGVGEESGDGEGEHEHEQGAFHGEHGTLHFCSDLGTLQ